MIIAPLLRANFCAFGVTESDGVFTDARQRRNIR